MHASILKGFLIDDYDDDDDWNKVSSSPRKCYLNKILKDFASYINQPFFFLSPFVTVKKKSTLRFKNENNC